MSVDEKLTDSSSSTIDYNVDINNLTFDETSLTNNNSIGDEDENENVDANSNQTIEQLKNPLFNNIKDNIIISNSNSNMKTNNIDNKSNEITSISTSDDDDDDDGDDDNQKEIPTTKLCWQCQNARVAAKVTFPGGEVLRVCKPCAKTLQVRFIATKFGNLFQKQ
jgi:hypothetical protein